MHFPVEDVGLGISSQLAYNGWGLIKRWRLKRFSYPTKRSYEKARKFPNSLSASVLLTPCCVPLLIKYAL